VNYHAYVRTLSPELVKAAALKATHMYYAMPAVRMAENDEAGMFQHGLQMVLDSADNGFPFDIEGTELDPMLREAWYLLKVHHLFKHGYSGSMDWHVAQKILDNRPINDWAYSARQWFSRRLQKAEAR
jgi:hypothetical protein